MSRNGRAGRTEYDHIWRKVESVVASGHSRNTVFEDWLNLILFSLLSATDNIQRPGFAEKLAENRLDGPYEDAYMKIVGKYKSDRKPGERPVDHLVQAWELLYQETRDRQAQRFTDVLGDIYENYITYGEAGQFFTPESLCLMMAKMQMNGYEKDDPSVLDPCCGSGRLLIAAGLMNPGARLYGVDIDARCVRVTVINMYLFNLNAVICCGDSLRQTYHEEWRVMRGGHVFYREIAEGMYTAMPKVTAPAVQVALPAPVPEELPAFTEGRLF